MHWTQSGADLRNTASYMIEQQKVENWNLNKIDLLQG